MAAEDEEQFFPLPLAFKGLAFRHMTLHALSIPVGVLQ